MATFELANTVQSSIYSEENIQHILAAASQVIDIPADFLFSIAIVSDDEIQPLNKQYRQKDYPTDVLSFRYDDESGEIIISDDRVREQATEYGNTLEEEGMFMIVHGILHIMGWDHERSIEEDKEQRELEVQILELCGLKCAR